MDFKHEKIEFCDKIIDRLGVYEETTDAIVPDSYPDIESIVCATGNIIMKDEAAQADRILVSGNVQTVILYKPEGEDKFRELNVPINFAHIEDAKGITAGDVCAVECKILSVEARAVNSRKISMNVRISCSVTAFTEAQMQFLTDIEDEQELLQVKKETYTANMIKSANVAEFAIIDDVEMVCDSEEELINARCSLKANDIKTMHSKLIVKGDIFVSSLIKNQENLRIDSKTIPFTQIMDCPDCEENSDVTLKFAIHNVDAQLQSNGMLSVGIGGRALLCIMQSNEIELVTDLYNTKYNLETQNKTKYIMNLEQKGQIYSEFNEIVQAGSSITQVIDSNAVCYGVAQEDATHLRLNAVVNCIVKHENETISCVNRTIVAPITLKEEITGCILENLTLNTNATISSGDKINVKINISADLSCKISTQISDYTKIEQGAPILKQNEAVTLVLKFADKNESIWNIAKRHNTTVQAIKTANNLGEQQIDCDKMLLIPICSTRTSN